MLKYLKSILAVTLSFAMLITVAGCGNGKEVGGNKNDVGFEKVDPITNDEVVDMKGYEFTIVSPFIFPDPEDALTVAEQQFHARCAEIEEEFNCKIKIVNQKTDTASIAATMLAGDKLGDIVQFDMADLYQAIGSGYLRPLNTIKGIDAADTRWEQGYTKMAYYKDDPYGLYFYRPQELRYCILYNKTMLKEYGITEDLNQLVRDGKWTFDKLRELAIACTKDTNGDGEPDTYGLITNTPEALATNFITANGGAVAKVINGKVTETTNEQSVVNALNFLHGLINTDKVMYVPEQWKTKKTYYAGGVGYKELTALFNDGKVAFDLTEAWIANQAVKPGSPKISYGLLPFPKGPDADKYYTPANFALVFAVTKNNKDIDKVVPIINALGKTAEGYEGEEWINDAIEMDYLQSGDSESVEMYKFTYNNSTFDIGMSIQSVWSEFSEVVAMAPIFWGQGTPASQLEAFNGTAQKALDNLFEK